MANNIKKIREKSGRECSQMKSVISLIKEGFIIIDSDYKIIMVNKAGKNILQITTKDFIGKNIKKVISVFKNKKEIPLEKWALEKELKNNKRTNINTASNIYLKSNLVNKTFPAEITFQSFSKNKFNEAIIVFRNIAELKLIKEERIFSKHNLKNLLESVYIERDNVQEEKTKLEAILNGIGDAVLAIDKQKRVMIFNPIAEKITGFKLNAVENIHYNDFFDFINEETKKPETDIINAALKGKAMVLSNNTALITKNKNLVLIDANVSPIKNKRGDTIGCIIVFRDVTEKRETERMRSDFVSTVSHQLRTPLSAMKWFTEILLNGDAGLLKHEQTDIINEIQASNQHMINFVNQMLGVSRIENDTLATNPKSINLNDSIEEIINEIMPIINEKKQDFKFNGLKNKSLKIQINKDLLRNIIHNILINASKYTANNGKINLDIKRKNKKYLLFEIKDNGIGIPKNEHRKLFKKFSRGSNAISYEASGTGLGLYITKSILDMIGGKIWFESKEKKGTIFFFTLPIDSLFCSINSKK